MTNEAQHLLTEYVQNGSEKAFRELVKRYIDLVYSTAVRLVGGDTHRAEDVAQTVFVDFARLASHLPPNTRLGGWLHRHTCFMAANMMRTERRRLVREREAMEMIALDNQPDGELARLAPVLDEAINELSEEDRIAIILRFYERQELRQVGVALGASENAAQKRVSRALDQLRALLQHRGVALSSAALSATLTAQAVFSAPTALAASILGVALAGSTAGTGTFLTTLKLMTMTKLQLAVASVLLLGLAAGLVTQYRSSLQLNQENKLLRQQVEQMDALQAGNERLSNQVKLASQETRLSKEQFSELLRLRGEVGVLRRQNQAGAKTGLRDKTLPPSSQAQPVQPALPFQLSLVVDSPDENAEVMTNNVKAANGAASPEMLYVRKTPAMDYTSLHSANVVSDPASGTSQIEILFNDQGREQFAQITKENINKRLAIAIDGQIYSAPVIRSEITGGKAMVSGNFTEVEARELAEKINKALASANP